MRKIQVANIIEESRVGGPQIRIMRIAERLLDTVNTTVVMPDNNSKMFVESLRKKKISYKAFRMRSISKGWTNIFRYILYFPYEIIQVLLFFRKKRFDLVHISGGSWQYKGFFAAKLSGTKVVWHLNDTYTLPVFRAVFNFLGRYADAYIFASNRTKSYYYKPYMQGKIQSVIAAPVDTDFFSPDVVDTPKVKLLSKGKTVVGMVANINPVKGVDIFIKMSNSVGAPIHDVLFVVIGPVYQTQEQYFKVLSRMNKELGDNIVFIGAQEDVRPWLKSIDIYVCPSNFESSPVSVWEAMSMGKPIVSTDVGDVSLYVQNDKNGYIVPAGDHRALARYVTHLLRNKQEVVRFGLESRRVAVEQLDVSICAKMHLDIYSSLSCLHSNN